MYKVYSGVALMGGFSGEVNEFILNCGMTGGIEWGRVKELIG